MDFLDWYDDIPHDPDYPIADRDKREDDNLPQDPDKWADVDQDFDGF